MENRIFDTLNSVPTPAYVIDEKKIRENLSILKSVEEKSGAKILLAQKAFSAFSLYPMISEYVSGTACSGLYEARLGFENMGKENHVFSVRALKHIGFFCFFENAH